MNSTHIIIGILVVLAYSFGDVFSKKFGETKALNLAIYSCLCYLVTTISWLFLVTKGMDIGKGSILFGVASAVCGLFVGCIIFKESMQLLDYIGVVFGMVSIILLSLK